MYSKESEKKSVYFWGCTGFPRKYFYVRSSAPPEPRKSFLCTFLKSFTAFLGTAAQPEFFMYVPGTSTLDHLIFLHSGWNLGENRRPPARIFFLRSLAPPEPRISLMCVPFIFILRSRLFHRGRIFYVRSWRLIFNIPYCNWSYVITGSPWENLAL